MLHFTKPQWMKSAWFHTLLGVVMTVIVGVVIYALQMKERELLYALNPQRTVIVNTADMSGLRILYNDKEVQGDVTALGISIWNHGKESIRSANIVRPVTIQLIPPQRILDVRHIGLGRDDITKIIYNRSKDQEGTVGLDWTIFEQNDG